MRLRENGFALLGARPTDDRKTLMQKADESALLGGVDTEAALNQLMQMNQRITAELSWFPGSTPDAAAAFLAYAQKVAEGHPTPLPPMEGLGTPLAQANGLYAFFENWPSDKPELFCGMCSSLDKLLSEVKAEEVFQAINAEREAGKWEPIQSLVEMEKPLKARLRELCEPVVLAAGKLELEKLSSALSNLFRMKDFHLEGDVAGELFKYYTIQTHEKMNTYKEQIYSCMEILSNKANLCRSDFQELKKVSGKWYSLINPLLVIPGERRKEADSIGLDLRNVILTYFSNVKPVSKTRTFKLICHNGSPEVSITYQSKSDFISLTISLIHWLSDTFTYQDDLKKMLLDDEAALKKMVEDEKEMIDDAKHTAGAQYGGLLFG